MKYIDIDALHNRHRCTTTPDRPTTLHETPHQGCLVYFPVATIPKLISLHTTPLSRGSLYFLVATLPTNLSLHTTLLSRGSLYFLVATLPTTLYHYIQHFYQYIKHLYQGGLYIFWWPHCPQTYITTYNTSIKGVFILSSGHTAHKLISLYTS